LTRQVRGFRWEQRKQGAPSPAEGSDVKGGKRDVGRGKKAVLGVKANISQQKRERYVQTRDKTAGQKKTRGNQRKGGIPQKGTGEEGR